MDQTEIDLASEEEEQIIRRVLLGETDEFRLLVERYQNRIYSLVMRQVGDASIARELSQDVFVRAYKSLSSFRFASRFSTWLVRIAMNTTNSYFSSREFKERSRQRSFESHLHAGASEHPDIEQVRREQLSALQTALGQLKPEQREIITLCYLEGKTYQEAADFLGIPRGTVCSRVNSSQHQLRLRFKRIYR